MKEEYKN